MKKLITVFLTMAAFAQGQTLTQSNHAPVAGDNYQTYQCDSLNVTPGPSGAGQNWNYAIATHSSIQSSYVYTASSHPSYAAATLSLTGPYGNTSFFDSDNSSLRYYGGHMVSPQQVDAHFFYTVPAVYAAYPMSLNTTSTSLVSGSVNIIQPVAANGTFTGTCIVTADATGTLTLPATVYNNIIRVATTQTLDCTTMLGNGSFYQQQYDYYQVGIKPPVFSISNGTLSTPLGDEYQTIVTRLVPPANTVGVSDYSFNSANSFYPNPAADKISFTSGGGLPSRVLFYGINGDLKATVEVSENGEFNVSALQEGIYFFRTFDASGALLGTGRQVINRQ